MATSKAQSLPSGILKLTKLLEHLNKPPRLTFTNDVKHLRLSLAFQNDHWGARHFVKEELPRIRYANPNLDIEVVKWRKEKDDRWRPELELKFDNGNTTVIDMNAKASPTILREVMAVAGGDPWKTHVEEATKAGEPIVPDERPQEKTAKKKKEAPLPTLWEFQKANVDKVRKAEQARQEREEKKALKKQGGMAKRESTGTEVTSHASVLESGPSIPETTPS